ncbi:unnamed protein product [Schistosoma mattheei]|uniref:choline-phosphate cytidylyltransferase n=1 Tax=Schistosoma mattheei TaxID=31246 RepID=A0AA85BIC3_9TREM|nr:unnamed protein product [Schistosoma mattheei]
MIPIISTDYESSAEAINGGKYNYHGTYVNEESSVQDSTDNLTTSKVSEITEQTQSNSFQNNDNNIHASEVSCSTTSSNLDNVTSNETKVGNHSLITSDNNLLPQLTLHSLAYRSPAPFWYEPLAMAANHACDYTIKITLEMAKSGKAPRPVRVYADGAYDMFHSGHARQLMQAKCAFPDTYLIVGVSNDADVHHYKKHKIDFVAHDDIPYASPDSEDVYKPLKDAGMFLVTQRTEGISTTDVIGRIVRDYDVYLRRNIRRGLSRKDLNISYMKEKSIQLQDNLENMMKRGSTFIQNFDSKRREFVDQLEDISHEVVRSFMRIFGSDGHLRHWWSSRRCKRPISSLNSTFYTPQTSPTCSASEDDDDDESEEPYSKKSRKCYSMTMYGSNSSSSFTDSDEQINEQRILCKKRPRITGDDYLSTFQTETTLTKNTTTINRFTNETRRNSFSRQGPKSEPKSRRNNYRSLRYCTERN